jgi:hypothetical protein
MLSCEGIEPAVEWKARPDDIVVQKIVMWIRANPDKDQSELLQAGVDGLGEAIDRLSNEMVFRPMKLLG